LGYALGLFLALAGLWISLSGHFETKLLAFGAGSILLAVFLAARLGTLDREGSPFGRLVQFLAYFPWLLWQIVLSNWAVAKAILKAEMQLSPALVKVNTRCRTDLAKATFANSITLTPGTVTVDIEGQSLLVHALFEAAAGPESFEEMDKRSQAAAEGQPKAAARQSASGGGVA